MTKPNRRRGEVTTLRLRRMAVYAGGMRAHAAARCAEAARILAEHAATAGGCCAQCAQPVPCPEAVAATEVHHRYRPWLAPYPPIPAGINRFGADPRARAFPGNSGSWR